jgi:hypothetical protein
LVTKLLGLAAEAIETGLGTGLNAWSIKHQVRFLEKTQRLFSEAGFEPTPVSPKLFLPIIQNASIMEPAHDLTFTFLGESFIEACRAPKVDLERE